MKKRIEFCVVAVVLLVLSVVFCGCAPKELERPVWGTGDLDPNWVSLFGDDNNARLDYVNTERINRLAPAVDEMAKRLMALELENPAELAERVRKLEAGDEGCPFEKMSGVRCEELPVHEHSHTGTVTDPNIPKEVENAVEKGEIPKDNQ